MIQKKSGLKSAISFKITQITQNPFSTTNLLQKSSKNIVKQKYKKKIVFLLFTFYIKTSQK